MSKLPYLVCGKSVERRGLLVILADPSAFLIAPAEAEVGYPGVPTRRPGDELLEPADPLQLGDKERAATDRAVCRQLWLTLAAEEGPALEALRESKGVILVAEAYRARVGRVGAAAIDR